MSNYFYYKLEKRFKEISQLKNILEITQWDFLTYAPAGGAQYKIQELATLASTVHSLESSDEVHHLIQQSQLYSEGLDKWQLSNLTLIKKTYFQSKALDQRLYKEYIEASAQCEFIWRDAKLHDDFKKLVPYLDKIFNITRDIAARGAENLKISKYDALLARFDHDNRESTLDKVFELTKKHLPPLISKILKRQNSRKIIQFTKPVDIKTQKQIALRVAQIIGFNFDKGRIDESLHPFSAGRNDDVRVTTKYDSLNILDNIYNILHEVGHGLYLQNLPDKYRNQPVGDFYGMSFHESQALFMEMQIGASRSFIELISKLLYDEFNLRGEEYSAENLYNLKTTVKPSLIRIEADEVTYPMHIILRYEIEKAIINGEVSAAELPMLWHKKMKEYFGVVPDKDQNGCMQDIHWARGFIGYFPNYYTGAITASMLASNIKKHGFNLDTEIRSYSFDNINHFLNKNLRNYGSSILGGKLIELSTDRKSVDFSVFFEYLENKYLDN